MHLIIYTDILGINLYIYRHPWHQSTLEASPLNSRRSVRPADSRSMVTSTLEASPLDSRRSVRPADSRQGRGKHSERLRVGERSSGMRVPQHRVLGDPFRVDVFSHFLSAGRTDLRLLRGDAISVFQPQHDFFSGISADICDVFRNFAENTTRNYD